MWSCAQASHPGWDPASGPMSARYQFERATSARKMVRPTMAIRMIAQRVKQTMMEGISALVTDKLPPTHLSPPSFQLIIWTNSGLILMI